MDGPGHKAVLAEEAVDAVLTRLDGCYIDATFGRGGHSRRLLARLAAEAHLLVIDRDAQAIAEARKLAAEDQRVQVEHASFSELSALLQRYPDGQPVDGILIDLGVSSPQLDEAERGFSFQVDGPLDMRMDQGQALDAAGFLAGVEAEELERVLREYGEERYARRIARAIIAARQEQPLTRTLQLADIVKSAHPAWERHHHPATRTFQALRLRINEELREIEQVLPQAIAALAPGGRLAVISFHSLEDRLVKRALQAATRGVEEVLPRGLPVRPQFTPPCMREVIRQQAATDEEVALNPRARSARLRVAEKL